MKKLILLSIVFHTSLVFSQEFELSAGYGAPSLYGVTEELGRTLGSVGTDEGSPASTGTLGISGVVYNTEAKWRYGLDFLYESYSKDGDYTKMSSISVMPKVDYFWSGKDKKLRLYSGGSVGLYLSNATIRNDAGQEEKSSETLFGFNLTPIGLRYGYNFAGFLEPNIGTKGLLQAGVSFIFK